MKLHIPLLLLAVAAATVSAAKMGENVFFDLADETMEEFHSVQEELKDDEVLKIQVFPMGLKDARPSLETPVWLWIAARDEGHHWVLPWSPGGGPYQQWLEVLLCTNKPSLELMAQTNSSTPLPMRWSVSTENVKLGIRTAVMKSTLADVSYRRFTWQDAATVAVDLEVSSVTGDSVCASLAVARRCVTHPHQLTDDHLLQRVRFARAARLTVSRADAPDGFWLYLIPEADNRRCPATAARGLDNLPPPAKTIKVSVQTRSFVLDGVTPRPQADWDLPAGSAVLAAESDWAAAPTSRECEQRLEQCQLQCGV